MLTLGLPRGSRVARTSTQGSSTPVQSVVSSGTSSAGHLCTRTRLPLSLAVLEAVPLSALTPSDVQAATKKTTVSINSAMLGTTQSVGSVRHTLEVGFLRLCPRATPAKLCAALHATSRTHRTTLRGNGPTYHFSSALGLVEVHPDIHAVSRPLSRLLARGRNCCFSG